MIRPIDDSAYEQLFRTEVAPMTRLAALLGDDDPESVVQEAFVRLHDHWHRIRDGDSPTGYLRTIVVNLVRARHRHLKVVRRHRTPAPPPAASAEQTAAERAEHAVVLTAIAALPLRRREALVLRYWLDLSEAEMAVAMSTSVGTVKSNLSRGLAALRAALVDLERADDLHG